MIYSRNTINYDNLDKLEKNTSNNNLSKYLIKNKKSNYTHINKNSEDKKILNDKIKTQLPNILYLTSNNQVHVYKHNKMTKDTHNQNIEITSDIKNKLNNILKTGVSIKLPHTNLVKENIDKDSEINDSNKNTFFHLTNRIFQGNKIINPQSNQYLTHKDFFSKELNQFLKDKRKEQLAFSKVTENRRINAVKNYKPTKNIYSPPLNISKIINNKDSNTKVKNSLLNKDKFSIETDTDSIWKLRKLNIRAVPKKELKKIKQETDPIIIDIDNQYYNKENNNLNKANNQYYENKLNIYNDTNSKSINNKDKTDPFKNSFRDYKEIVNKRDNKNKYFKLNNNNTSNNNKVKGNNINIKNERNEKSFYNSHYSYKSTDRLEKNRTFEIENNSILREILNNTQQTNINTSKKHSNLSFNKINENNNDNEDSNISFFIRRPRNSKTVKLKLNKNKEKIYEYLMITNSNKDSISSCNNNTHTEIEVSKTKKNNLNSKSMIINVKDAFFEDLNKKDQDHNKENSNTNANVSRNNIINTKDLNLRSHNDKDKNMNIMSNSNLRNKNNHRVSFSPSVFNKTPISKYNTLNSGILIDTCNTFYLNNRNKSNIISNMKIKDLINTNNEDKLNSSYGNNNNTNGDDDNKYQSKSHFPSLLVSQQPQTNSTFYKKIHFYKNTNKEIKEKTNFINIDITKSKLFDDLNSKQLLIRRFKKESLVLEEYSKRQRLGFLNETSKEIIKQNGLFKVMEYYPKQNEVFNSDVERSNQEYKRIKRLLFETNTTNMNFWRKENKTNKDFYNTSSTIISSDVDYNDNKNHRDIKRDNIIDVKINRKYNNNDKLRISKNINKDNYSNNLNRTNEDNDNKIIKGNYQEIKAKNWALSYKSEYFDKLKKKETSVFSDFNSMNSSYINHSKNNLSFYDFLEERNRKNNRKILGNSQSMNNKYMLVQGKKLDLY